MSIDAGGWRRHLIDKELAQNTIDSYMYALNDFAKMYSEVTKASVVEYKRDLMVSGKTPKTINCRIGALNQYAAWAGIRCGVKPIKTQKQYSLDNVITLEQKDALLDGLMTDKDMQGWAMVSTLASTGVRVAELTQLRKTFVVDGWQTISNKGKTRRVCCPQRLGKSVSPYYESIGGPFLFFKHGTDGHVPISCRAVNYRLAKYAERYDIPRKVCHAHSFRHLFGKEFARRNGNLTLLADLMGHSSVATTQIYTRMSEQEQKQTLDEVVRW